MSKKLFTIITIAVILLAACSNGKVDYEGECIVGIWEVLDSEAYARSLLPPGSFDPKTLQFMRGNQELAYKFDADGTISILGVDWSTVFESLTPPSRQLLDLKITGFASGSYRLEGDTITVGEVTDNRITYVAVLDGEIMASESQVGGFAVLFVPPYKTARYTCNQDQLNLWLIDYPGYKEAITFTRAE